MPMGFRAFASIWYPAVTGLPVLSEIRSPSGADAYATANVWLADLLPGCPEPWTRCTPWLTDVSGGLINAGPAHNGRGPAALTT
jgi:hypothetical protein